MKLVIEIELDAALLVSDRNDDIDYALQRVLGMVEEGRVEGAILAPNGADVGQFEILGG